MIHPPQIISSEKAPAAIGPYSQAVRCGQFIFCSGQIPIDPASGELITGDVAAQTERCLLNLSALLHAAGAGLPSVVKVTVFLTDLANFQAMNEVYARYFKTRHPARSTIQVAGLPKGSSVEIEAVAFLPDGDHASLSPASSTLPL